ncbi:MAG: CDGSH iron-sulfur domain-containing protein [Mycobacteriales bacterium]
MQIRVTPQGPYVVSDAVAPRRARPVKSEDGEPIAWERDAPIEAGEEYSLCRCGGSSNKPFCDGTHETRDWDGTETAPATSYLERAKVLGGEGITVRDDRGLCQHAGFCSTKISNVWKLTKQTSDAAVRTQVAGMVGRCPSGALTYALPGDDGDVEPLAEGIAVIDDGPLWVTGSVPVGRADAEPLETRNRMVLCRCGQSETKPLCDGSHTEAGFTDHA